MNIGAYAVERDYSHYVAYLSKTVFAVVGTATKGPIGKATVCTSSQDLVNKFGPLKTDCLGLYAGQYFLSQATKMYFVRAASSSAAGATIKIEGKASASSETSVSDAITLTLLDKGTAGNSCTLIVSAGDTGTYNLTLLSGASKVLETIKNVSLSTLVAKQGTQYTYKTDYFEVTGNNNTATLLSVGTYDTEDDGNDGISNITAADYVSAAEALKAETVDMNLFAVPGQSDRAVVTAMLNLAEERGDCLYLVDPPKGLTIEGVIDWHNATGTYQAVDASKFNSSYGALYYDWVTIYDSINKVRVQVPPSVTVAATIAYSDRVSELWYAPAGLNRGIIRGVLGSTTKLSKTDVELLYSDNNNINALYDDPSVGLVVWGQKTLHREDTALNRVNVRRLMSYLKKVVTAACNYLTFEPNDRVTWNSFEMKVQPILQSIKDNRGIYDYSIVKGETIVTDEDIDNYRMPCMIMIRPTKAAEEIPIYFVLTSTGADFNEILEANGVIVDND